jgi:hypothetical protein
MFDVGVAGPTSLTGDWEGDGDDTVGLFNPATGRSFLRNSNSSGQPDAGKFTFSVGVTGLTPVTGDWDGDGDDTIGLFNLEPSKFFLRNSNDSGQPDAGKFVFWDIDVSPLEPVTGDWNGS